MRKHKTLHERLWAKITQGGPDDCWPWTGGTAGKGYGTLKKLVDGKWKTQYAHREVLIETSGSPPTPLSHALHSCDNPICCNPKHLSWGTNSINRREARDRLHNQGKQKLLPDQVERIRVDPRIYADIAADYNIHRDTVARIKQNRSWLP